MARKPNLRPDISETLFEKATDGITRRLLIHYYRLDLGVANTQTAAKISGKSIHGYWCESELLSSASCLTK